MSERNLMRTNKLIKELQEEVNNAIARKWLYASDFSNHESSRRSTLHSKMIGVNLPPAKPGAYFILAPQGGQFMSPLKGTSLHNRVLADRDVRLPFLAREYIP